MTDFTKRPIVQELSDRFEFLELLGDGGMGSVYKVFDRELKATFALKVLRAELTADKLAIKRFMQEAQMAQGLTHPNIVAVYQHAVSTSGSPYLIMDYLRGQTLAEAIKQNGTLSPKRVIEIFIQVLEGLAFAHEKGIIHRDIKPSNIMLEQGASRDYAKLLDFGIAKAFQVESETSETMVKTQSSDIIGSPLCMSPEQCQGTKIDKRSDIYSVGCVMYEALTGKPPFVGENQFQIMTKHVYEAPKAMALVCRSQDIPEPLELVVATCLKKSPGDRYASAEALLKDLRALDRGEVATILERLTTSSITPQDRSYMTNGGLLCLAAIGFTIGVATGNVLSQLLSIALGIVALVWLGCTYLGEDRSAESYEWFFAVEPGYAADKIEAILLTHQLKTNYETALYWTNVRRISGSTKSVIQARVTFKNGETMDFADFQDVHGEVVREGDNTKVSLKFPQLKRTATATNIVSQTAAAIYSSLNTPLIDGQKSQSGFLPE